MSTTPERLSSDILTVLYKFVFPTVWCALSGVATIAAVATRGPWPIPAALLLFGGALTLTLATSINHVSIDAEFLYIDGPWRSDTVQLSAIDAVERSARFFWPPRVWVFLRSPTRFGLVVGFIPADRFALDGVDPISRLRNAAGLENP